MKKRQYFSMFLLAMAMAGYAQTGNPGSGITYQAVILKPHGQELPGQNNDNAPLTNSPVCLQFSIIDGQSQIEYQETVQVKTDKFGMVNLMIGLGKQVGGYANTFAGVNWGKPGKKLRVELDSKGDCSSFVFISEEPFGAVPYALAADPAGIPDGSITDAKIESVSASKITGVVPISNGGTGATNATDARTNLGLGNVDNTADKDKPVSTAQQAALDLKEDKVNKQNSLAVDGTGVKFPTVDAVNNGLANLAQQINNIGTVGLAGKEDKVNKQNSLAIDGTGTKFPTVDAVNAANALKADKTYVDSQDALKAPLASPALTGVPTVPTAPGGTNTTQIASTAFVANAVTANNNNIIEDAVNDGVVNKVPTENAVYDALKLKADDNKVVHLAGAETITGDKNLIGNTTVANLTLGHNPTTGPEAANKSYVDLAVATNSLYKGTFDASTGLDYAGAVVPAASAFNKGYNYICKVAGSTPIACNVGDHIASNGTTWEVIPASSFILTSQTQESNALPNLGFAGPSNQQAINNAVNNLMVRVSGDQTIAGNKDFTGTLTAATAPAGTNTTQVATTAFVTSALTSNNNNIIEDVINDGVINKVPTENAVFDALALKADKTALNQEITDRTNADNALTAQISQNADGLAQEIIDRTNADALKAPLASPGLTGIPTAPTAPAGNDSTQIATTAFVNSAIATAVPDATNSVKGKVQLATVAETQAGTDNAKAITPFDLKPVVDAKADDNKVVHLTGTETITGDKSLNGNTTIANLTLGHDPAAGPEAATKNYVDLMVATNSLYQGTFNATSGQDFQGHALPTPSKGGTGNPPSNVGYSYICDVAGSIPAPCNVGDHIVSNGISWEVIPASSFILTAQTKESNTLTNLGFTGPTNQQAINTAVDNLMVKVSGDQSISGNKDFTGTLTAPTATLGTSTTQVATTEFVNNAVTANLEDAINDNITNKAPTENAVYDALALKAPLASPALTGVPTAPTAAATDSSTQIATTAFVKNADTNFANTDLTATVARTHTFNNALTITGTGNKSITQTSGTETWKLNFGGTYQPLSLLDTAPTKNNGISIQGTVTTVGADDPTATTGKRARTAYDSSFGSAATTTRNNTTDGLTITQNYQGLAFTTTGVGFIGLNLPIGSGGLGNAGQVLSSGGPTSNMKWQNILPQTVTSGTVSNTIALDATNGSQLGMSDSSSQLSAYSRITPAGTFAFGMRNAAGARMDAAWASDGVNFTASAGGAYRIGLNGNYGTAGQVLTSGGAGNLTWTTISGTTNLTYTASPTNGLVNSSTGTAATIPVATATNAGLLAPADFTKLSTLSTTYAPLASPALTGTPTAPTATAGTNTTQLATTAFVTAAVASATIPDATSSVKGKIQLAGDLGGTAAAPTVPGLALKENLSNKSTDGTFAAADNTLYPSALAVKTYVGSAIAGSEVTSNKQNSLAADATNTKYPTVTAVNTGLATKEDLTNKSTDATFAAATNAQYPSALAVKTYVGSAIAGSEVTANKQNSLAADATNTKYPTVTAVNTGLATKEDLTNKSTDGTFAAADNTLYPSTLAVKTYVGSAIAGSEVTTNKQNSLAADATNTKYPTVTAVNTGLVSKEDTANKQNSLNVDGSGTKFPTVDAVNGGLIAKENASNKSTDGTFAAADNTQYPSALAVKTFVNSATNGAEFTANKQNDLSADATNTKYPTVTAVNAGLASKANSTTLINTTSPLQGGGDLSANRTLSIQQANGSQDGYLLATDWTTFNTKQNALGFTPENVANKSTDGGFVSPTDTQYPSALAVKTYIDLKLTSSNIYKGTFDASLSSPAITHGSGFTYICTTAGDHPVVGLQIGDHIVSDGTNWQRIPASSGLMAFQIHESQAYGNLGTSSTDNQQQINAAVNSKIGNMVDTVNNQLSIAGDKTFTGIVSAPTATAGTNTTQVATTAFVTAAVSGATIVDATTTVKGKVQLATDVETLAGTDNTKAVTPFDVKAVDAKVVHLAGTETITGSKTFTANVGIGAAPVAEKLEVTGTVKANNYTTPVQTFTGASAAWNMDNGSSAKWTLAAGANTLTLSNMKAGMYGSIVVTNTGTSTIAFSGGTNKVINGGGGVPTLTPLAGAVDILTFFYDGSTFWWTVGNNYN